MSVVQRPRTAANPPWRLPPPLFDLRRRGSWFALAVVALVVASFASLDLRWAEFAAPDALASMGRFLREFVPPDTDPAFLGRVARATVETLAMSALGTLLAALAGLALALPAARLPGELLTPSAGRGAGHADRVERAEMSGPAARRRPRIDAAAVLRTATRWLLNAMRSVPELVWAALLLVSAGLGPFAGTLALAAHTTGVLGRLFAEAIENVPPGPAQALRAQGVDRLRTFAWATGPQVLPQLLSYTLYRWENNIRAATVLGVVGAGGLGQLLAFHMGLFHMGKTATLIGAMVVLVLLVDAASVALRRWSTR